jgi:hypothetical protein
VNWRASSKYLLSILGSNAGVMLECTKSTGNVSPKDAGEH